MGPIIPPISIEDKLSTISWMLDMRLLKASSRELE